MEKIPVCVAYEVDGERVERFPSGDSLNKATPVIEYLDGWKTDISKCRSTASLPAEAINYIRYLERTVGCSVKYVSVGAEREDYLIWGGNT
jgi:adenylosuccinate synthase